MDAGLSIKSVSAAVASDYVRPIVAASTAATDLPDSQTVTPAPVASPTQNDVPLSENSSSAYIAHSITIDPQSREVIYRVIDTRTRQVIQQVPDAALLRSRAYSKAIADGSSPFDAQSRADLKA
jgi:hypothetical protein